MIDYEYLVNLPDFAPKRYETLALVCQGKTYKEIATMRGKSYQTVKNEIYLLRQRIGAKNIAHLVHLAHQVNII